MAHLNLVVGDGVGAESVENTEVQESLEEDACKSKSKDSQFGCQGSTFVLGVAYRTTELQLRYPCYPVHDLHSIQSHQVSTPHPLQRIAPRLCLHFASRTASADANTPRSASTQGRQVTDSPAAPRRAEAPDEAITHVR